jgi:hypothetical protein
MHTDGRYLNTGSGKTEQIPFPTAQSHGGKSRFRAIVLRQFLIQTDVPLFVIMGENGTNPAKKYGHSRMTTRESMIQILENGYVFSMLFQGGQSLGHFVSASLIRDRRKECLLINPVII